jgi:hypothetical protein
LYRSVATAACTGECNFCGPAASLTLPASGEYQCIDFFSGLQELNGPVSSIDECEGVGAALYRPCDCQYPGGEQTPSNTTNGDLDNGPPSAPPTDSGSGSSSMRMLRMDGPATVLMALFSTLVIGFDVFAHW